MAVVSDDHGDESLNTEGLNSQAANGIPLISAAAIQENNKKIASKDKAYWAVVDGFVVDATDFLDTHPGGLQKLLQSNAASAGYTGNPFGFSFTRGKNAHFPETGRTFKEGVERYLRNRTDNQIQFKGMDGKLRVLGRLAKK